MVTDKDRDNNKSYIVKGVLLDESGTSLKSIIMRAFDKGLRKEEPLGETKTAKDGSYKIEYSADMFKKAEKESADLVVKAYGAKNELLATSDIFFNAPREAKIDLTIPSLKYKLPSEFERIKRDIEPLLKGAKVRELEENDKYHDVTFLAGETGFSRACIEHFIISHRLYLKTKITCEFWYGILRQSLLADPSTFLKGDQTLATETENILNKMDSLKREDIFKSLKRSIHENAFPEDICGYLVEYWIGLIARRRKLKRKQRKR